MGLDMWWLSWWCNSVKVSWKAQLTLLPENMMVAFLERNTNKATAFQIGELVLFVMFWYFILVLHIIAYISLSFLHPYLFCLQKTSPMKGHCWGFVHYESFAVSICIDSNSCPKSLWLSLSWPIPYIIMCHTRNQPVNVNQSMNKLEHLCCTEASV